MAPPLHLVIDNGPGHRLTLLRFCRAVERGEAARRAWSPQVAAAIDALPEADELLVRYQRALLIATYRARDRYRQPGGDAPQGAA
jgi:hypothetical protein